MMKLGLLLTGLVFVSHAIPTAHAQVSLDVSKITCDQYTGYRVTNPQNIAIWLNGYYNGKRGNTILDTQALMADARKLQDYCFQNPNVPVMQAVESLFGVSR